MHTDCTYLPYRSTGYFSSIVLDYISGEKELQPYYNYAVTTDGIKAAIANRKLFATDRALLVKVLNSQYSQSNLTEKQQQNIEKLGSENTFTICTAHQPNIFTGQLYFIYKILHTIKLANTLSLQINDAFFVPVYYMGSEDADLDELGHIYLNGIKYEWKTNQKGAVGRMKVDKALLQLIDAFSVQLLAQEYGVEIVDMMKRCYQLGVSIEQATFTLVNELFAEYGLLILLPDSPLLKNAFAPISERELLQQFSHKEVAATVAGFPLKYKVQATGRALNLFYLTDEARARIELADDSAGGDKQWLIADSEKRFSKDGILEELKVFPERFSPNVILRPVFQEMVLPNVAFIGGGGEIAYWLELKKVFDAAGVPYPMLVVRNSFVLVEEKSHQLQKKLQLTTAQIFQPELDVMNALVKMQSHNQLSLGNEKQLLAEVYSKIKAVASNVDSTLQQHTDALHKKALNKIGALEKKILKAEKEKFDTQQRHLHKLKMQLFPNNNLQERVENFMSYYSRSGKGFINEIYNHSLTLEQEFSIVTC